MKFSDGHWHIPEHLKVQHPVYVHDVRVEGDEVVADVAALPFRSRLDQVHATVFTVRLFAPAEGIVGVRFSHYEGVRPAKPAFALNRVPGAGRVAEDERSVTLHSGDLAATLPKSGPYALDFSRGGERITGSIEKSAGYAVERDTAFPYMFERLDLTVGTNVYGLGERFTPFVKNGQSVDIWNEDGGTQSEQAYKNIPFFITNRGWGLLVNHPGRVSFEIASTKVTKAQFSVSGESLEYMVIDGPTPKDVLTRYTGLTGRPALPPVWSFGLWLSTSFTTQYDEATVNSFVDGMLERDIPLGVFHFDCFWMRGLNWCDFEWDPETFPDPVGQLARLKARGGARLRLDQPLYRPAFAALRRRPRQGLPAEAPERRRLAMGSLAAGHGLRRLHQSRCRRLVSRPPEAPARHGRRLLQDRLRRAHPHRCGVARRLRSGAHAQLLHLPLQQGGLRAIAGGEGRGRHRVCAFGNGRQPAIPGPLGRRQRIQLRVHGGEPARRAVAGTQRLRFLEPRHLRL